jgi:tetratricopeptide (TPR) repeat protein
MLKLRFIFSETLLTLGLIFLGLVAAKAVGGLRARLAWVRGVLYTAILALVVLGARGLALGLSAGIHAWQSEDDIGNMRVDHAYSNALRAVELRPAELDYWKDLSLAKFREAQFASLLKDEPVFRILTGGKLDEETMLRLAYCHYFLGEYDPALAMTDELIHNNRYFAAPYVLEGMTYVAEKKFARAEQVYLAVLQMFPSQEPAVEGLAHVHYLMGHPDTAIKVLDETSKFPFPAPSRKRFEDLKAFYAQ